MSKSASPKEKISYSLDPHNRLVINKGGKKSQLRRFRRVLDGQFKTGKNNDLVYHIKAPVTEDVKAPHQVKLKGRWSLTKSHDLRFTLDKWRRQTFGDELTLQGDIIDVNKNSLLFALTTRNNNGSQSIYLLKLEGVWQADEKNRLSFRIKRGKEKPELLSFDGIWDVNKDYQLSYSFEKAKSSRKPKKIHTITFKGSWDIKDKTRISYLVDGSSACVFNFKTGIGIFRDKYIKYELGIGLSRRKKPVKKIISFFGSWKISKDRGLTFEVERAGRKIQSIALGAEVRLSEKNMLLFRLRNYLNRDIVAQLELERKILKGEGEAFLRLLKSADESAILIGCGRGW